MISYFPIGTIPKFPIWMTLVYAFMTTKGIHKCHLRWILRKRSWCVVDLPVDLWVCLFFIFHILIACCLRVYIFTLPLLYFFYYSILLCTSFPCAVCPLYSLPTFTTNWVVKIFFFNFENYLLTAKVISHLWQMATMLPLQRNSNARAYLSR